MRPLNTVSNSIRILHDNEMLGIALVVHIPTYTTVETENTVQAILYIHTCILYNLMCTLVQIKLCSSIILVNTLYISKHTLLQSLQIRSLMYLLSHDL